MSGRELGVVEELDMYDFGKYNAFVGLEYAIEAEHDGMVYIVATVDEKRSATDEAKQYVALGETKQNSATDEAKDIVVD